MTVMKDFYINRKLYESIVPRILPRRKKPQIPPTAARITPKAEKIPPNDIKNGDPEIFRISVFDINGYSIFNKRTSC